MYLRKIVVPLLSILFFIAPLPASVAAVYISEIMASNSGSLIDIDGEESDWIELFNDSETPVDLTGWYLTDSEIDLAQWAFPATTTIAAKEFLIIFASGKESVPGELHANFKLSASGEQVILVQPDGTTVADQQVFPAMPKDVSYGRPFHGGGTNVVLDSGAACSAHVPTSSDDSSGWQSISFNDSAWQSGTTGVGYETETWGTTYTSLIGLTLPFTQSGWRTIYPVSAYIRIPFTVTDRAKVRSLILKMKYDDGFVAYLNGTQVQTANAPEPLAWNSRATSTHDDNLAIVFEEFDLTPYVGLLNEGDNILAIHGLNQANSSGDMLIVPRIEVEYVGEIDPSSSGLFSSPTPGAENESVVYEDFVETPVAYPERGFYDEPIQVTLSNVTPGATIRYTTDGSEPTASSTVYTGPITISGTTPLRSKAFIDGWRPSFSRTDTYLYLDDVIALPRTQVDVLREGAWKPNPIITGMDSNVLNKTYYDANGQLCTVRDALLDIPTISVVTDNDNLFDAATGIYVNPAEDWEKPASIELINPDGSVGFQSNSGLRIRGGYSRHDGYPKHAFRLFFRKSYGAGKLNYPLFEDEGVDEFDKIDLATAQNYCWSPGNQDPPEKNTFLRDIFARDSSRDMGATYTRSRFYHLYLNGVYWGIYLTQERAEANYAASYFGGDESDYDVVKASSWRDSPSQSIKTTDGTLDAYSRLLQAAMNGFANNTDYFAVLGLDSNGRPDPTKEKLVDINDLMDYLLVIYYTAATDTNLSAFWGNHLNNLYGIYNRENPDGFKWALHDCEHALDTAITAPSLNNNLSLLDRTGPFTQSDLMTLQYFNPQTLHEKLLDNAEYRIAFADRIYKRLTNNGALTQARSEARLEARKAQIDRAIIANAARWGNANLDRDTWLNAVSEIRYFFVGRENVVMGYLDADGLLPTILPPTLSHAGGLIDPDTQVSISAAQGNIYYTTDGSDPRAIGGAIQGAPYNGPLSFNKPTLLKARAWSGSEWSALSEAVFMTDKIPLVVTELMYNAPQGNQADFIEIRNASTETVSLNGYTLDSAIDFTFSGELEPGAFLVVVKDIDLFSATYFTNGIRVAGEYRRDFSNSGEKVDLEFHDQNVISFSYSDARNWPQAADGGGHSLVPIDSAIAHQARGSLDYGGNWRASTLYGGSPGYADLVPGATVLLNEITAHTDTESEPPFDSNDQIELYNPTESAIVLNGCYLSDDLDEPYKWAIPDGTEVPALGFVLFDEDDFHPDRIAGFGLDKAGEMVILSSPNGIVDVIRFKGQENGASLGRFPDGSENWMVTVPTPDAPNQLAEQQVWIGELMYNPAVPFGYTDGDMLEYIRIDNIGGTSVAFATAAGAWRIDGGVSYTFPADFVLPAGEKVWLVPFDPSNTAAMNLFRTTYGIDPAYNTILGPFHGKLSNRGERVALERPQDSDDPLLPLDISWVVVDEVYYFDQAPWPAAADGTGDPLTRSGNVSWIVRSAADTDGDQLDDAWEDYYFGSLDQEPNDDPDNDGFNNRQEQIAGTDPTDSASRFRVESAEAPTIRWTAVEGRTYSIYWTDDLQKSFELIAWGLTYPTSSFTDTEHGDDSSGYYIIAVDLE